MSYRIITYLNIIQDNKHLVFRIKVPIHKMMSNIIPKVKPIKNKIVRGLIPLFLLISENVKNNRDRALWLKQANEINFVPYRLLPQQHSCLAIIFPASSYFASKSTSYFSSPKADYWHINFRSLYFHDRQLWYSKT